MRKSYKHKDKFSVIMAKEKEVKTIVITFAIILILMIAGTAYGFYSLFQNVDSMEKDLTTQILVLNKNFIETLEKINNLEEEIFNLRNNLSIKLSMAEKELENFREENKKELNTLNQLIEQIEEQSDIKLQELKEEVSNIQVQSEDFSGIIDDVLSSTVSVGTDRGVGSGAIIDDEGFIVTNFHVVDNARIIRVLTYSGKVYDAEFVGYEENVDIAVLKIPDEDFSELRFDDSDDVKVGEKVIALGSPAGLSFTVTEGIVSAVGRTVSSNNLPIYIQTDVPINPGNSGGPLVNTRGRIIGINNQKLSGFESLGFAIESNTVSEIVDEIIELYEEE